MANWPCNSRGYVYMNIPGSSYVIRYIHKECRVCQYFEINQLHSSIRTCTEMMVPLFNRKMYIFVDLFEAHSSDFETLAGLLQSPDVHLIEVFWNILEHSIFDLISRQCSVLFCIWNLRIVGNIFYPSTSNNLLSHYQQV